MEAVDVRDLLAEPGSSRRLQRAEAFEGLRTELAVVADDDPIAMDLLLESVVEGILVSGPLSGRIAYRCARCLTDFTEEFSLDVTELFAHAPREDEDEYPIIDEQIDLEPMVRDAVILSIPFSPLCGPDCLGLCERCGGDRNLGECSCGPAIDPRWSTLDALGLD